MLVAQLCFDSKLFITFLVGLFLRIVGTTRFFYLVDVLPVLIPTYMRNLKIICQGEVCKIDKTLSLSIKTLKNMTLKKDGKQNIFFTFEILAPNLDWSQILKNICQQLLSLNNVLKSNYSDFTYVHNLTAWRDSCTCCKSLLGLRRLIYIR